MYDNDITQIAILKHMPAILLLGGLVAFAGYMIYYKSITAEKKHNVCLFLSLAMLISSATFLFPSFIDIVQRDYLPTEQYLARIVGTVLVGLFIPGIFFLICVIMAIIGITIQRKGGKEEMASLRLKTEDAARVKAWNEVKSNTINHIIWAKAFEEAEGNESKAKALYLKYRAKEIIDEEKISDQKRKQINGIDQKHPQEKSDAPLWIAVFIFALLYLSLCFISI